MEFAWANMIKVMVVPRCSRNQVIQQVEKDSQTVILRSKKHLEQLKRNEHLECDEKRDLQSSSFVLSLTVLSLSFAKAFWDSPLFLPCQAAQFFGPFKAIIL